MNPPPVTTGPSAAPAIDPGPPVAYTLLRRRRRTLAISVLPDGAVEVVAPPGADAARVDARVQARRPWIERQRRRFSALRQQAPARRYVSGETCRYLGRQYRLKVLPVSDGDTVGVKLRAGRLEVRGRTGDPAGVERLLADWYRFRAQEQFHQRLQRWRPYLEGHRLAPPTLRLRVMAKRWGSCTPDGVVLLHPDLIKAPSECVDYVVAHEICHLRFPNHGAEFYQELARVCPGWQTLKTRLESAEL